MNVAPGTTEEARKPLPHEELSTASFVSENRCMRDVLATCWRVAPTEATVLILGENGTGKTALARVIHQRSLRASKPFVVVNCPALQEQLLESELFGHVRGSFTGATSDTMGKVAAAEGGTLFLDEIGELPLAIQPRLLRLLQDGSYERLGETTLRHANVRVIAATNRDLKFEVEAGRFRDDLYYRLNVISVEVLPLRQRAEDIAPLAEKFLREFSQPPRKGPTRLTDAALAVLRSYPWPGNLRELRNAIERAAILTENPELDADDFAQLRPEIATPPPKVGDLVTLEALESEHIRRVLARTGSYERAAKVLGVDKTTLYRRRRRSRIATDTPEATPPAS
jgi:two-component system, NtrC family, response regulator AlgB